MSKIQLSEQQHIQLLSKGLKFVPTPRSINTVNNIFNCEKSLFSATLIIKNAPVSEMSTFLYKKWEKKQKNYNMNKEEIKLIEDIIIVQADKGRIFVIIDTID
jgi:sporulation protein YlmC with PRC-barrel domain